jgi:hypothetical protein
LIRTTPPRKSIVETSLRALKPAAGRNLRDAQHRLNKGRKVLAEALQGDQIPDHGVFPGLDNRWSVPGEGPVAILLPVESFERITEKIVRGIYYIEDGIIIEPPYEIDFYAYAPMYRLCRRVRGRPSCRRACGSKWGCGR